MISFVIYYHRISTLLHSRKQQLIATTCRVPFHNYPHYHPLPTTPYHYLLIPPTTTPLPPTPSHYLSLPPTTTHCHQLPPSYSPAPPHGVHYYFDTTPLYTIVTHYLPVTIPTTTSTTTPLPPNYHHNRCHRTHLTITLHRQPSAL